MVFSSIALSERLIASSSFLYFPPRGREIFQAALKQTKMVLQVLPYVDGCSFINLADDPASVTKPRVLRLN
ncbi:unnamed protein product, partial [Dibothriocephalus latus]